MLKLIRQILLHPLKYLNILLSPLRVLIIKIHGVQCGTSILVLGAPHIDTNKGNITLGNRIRLVSSQANHEIGLPSPVVLTTKGHGKIIVGDDSVINGATLRAHAKIQIGTNVWITAGCYIFDSHGHSTDAINRRRESDILGEIAPVVIEDNVWIGIRSIILPGVTIGYNSVIGAGSVVTNSIPPNSLAAGIPAKVISTLNNPIPS